MRTLSLSLLLLAACEVGTDPKDDTGLASDLDGDGYTVEDGDCDDESAAVHPGQQEICNEVDDDCDGDVDEEVAATWFPDEDGDGFGDDDAAVEACTQPAGASSVGGDCDDGDGEIHPMATEVCDGVDNDCDGEVDDPAEIEHFDWYPDADADGYGSEDDVVSSCQQPSGYLEVAGDCDDTDATIHEGADEDGGDGTHLGDGVDNDCDDLVDEGLRYGSGVDGAQSLDDASPSLLGQDCARVFSVSDDRIQVESGSSFAEGERVLLINLQGDEDSTAAAGRWELLDVLAMSGNDVVVHQAPARSFGPDSSSLGSQVVLLVRVPQYTAFELAGTLTADDFVGECGGVVAVVATESITVDGGIAAAGVGYRGGEENEDWDSTGQAGESLAGKGDKTNAANDGGGGGGGESESDCDNCEGNGGGGGHAEPGGVGEPVNSAQGDGGEAGGSVGDAELTTLHFGSGGGAGAQDDPSEGGIGGRGGDGGGIVLLFAPLVSIQGTVDVGGQDGERACASLNDYCGTGSGSEAGSGGGGAGGAIYIGAHDLELADGALSATGGSGVLAGSSEESWSGAGSPGRIRLDFDTLNGHAHDSAEAGEALEAACEPEVGWTTGA